MELYILNPAYEVIGLVDDSESILWSKKYNDVGYCEIYTPCSADLITMLRRGNYVFRFDDDMFCKIETVEIKTDAERGDYIIATATDACQILAGRIVRRQITHSGKVAKFIKRVLTENVISPAEPQRAVPNFTIDESNFSELEAVIDISTNTDDILQLILTTCKTCNYGFRVSYDISAGVLVFRLYRGKNKASTESDEYIEFSTAFANILSSSYKEDETNYKNIAYVSYVNQNGSVRMTSVYSGEDEGLAEPSGESRVEIHVDGTNVSRDITLEELEQMYPSLTLSPATDDDGNEIVVYKSGGKIVATGKADDGNLTVTEDTYLILLRILGKNVLAERMRSQVFTGAVDWVDTYEYKTDYNLGDIVRVVNEYGIEAAAQITEIMESEDNENGYEIEPHFEYLN